MESRSRTSRKAPPPPPARPAPKAKTASTKKFAQLLEKRSVRKRRDDTPSRLEISRPQSVMAEKAPLKKRKVKEDRSPPKDTLKSSSGSAVLVPVSFSAEGREQITSGASGHQSSSSNGKDYIRNTISLPQMNNVAEELLIDGFALVSFLTKEDLDVSLRNCFN